MKTEVICSAPQVTNLYQDLIDKCSKGDHRAQFKIFRLYFKPMYMTSLRIINNPNEAAEIMKESLLSAFEIINTYTGSESFESWLKKIVINKSLAAIGNDVNEFPDNNDLL